MAQSVQVHMKDATTKIVIDGNEVHDVVSYLVSGSVDDVPKLKIEIAIHNDLEVQLES